MTPEIRDHCPLLQVFDMPKSLGFYRDLLGFEVVQQAPSAGDCDWALLRRGEIELILNTMYEASDRPPAPDPARIAAHGDTALFLSSSDVDGIYAYLQMKGLDMKEPVVRDYGMKQLWQKDPDGYSICFQWPAS
ncbi:MAG: VOC family protein [Candidatus Hydrogenedentes bacterium]|nr:VOC family protein [Candidatus Hydrogenedentota bacterium]